MGVWSRAFRRLVGGGVLAIVASSCVGSCEDDSPCEEAFATGDRLEVTLAKLFSGADGDTCLTNAGLEPGTKLVMTIAESTRTRLGCTGYLVDLEIRDYVLSRNTIPSDERMAGGDFDAVYKGVCSGLLRFDLAERRVTTLPVRADSVGDDSPVLGRLSLYFPAVSAACPGASCTEIFYVDIDRAGPRDGGEGDK